MRIDVLLGEAAVQPAAAAGRVVVVIDVLRAATTAAAALANGARAVVPFASIEDAARYYRSFSRGEAVLSGERNMRAVEGFDHGNSPLEHTREAVSGRTVVLTTSNGTKALKAAERARVCLLAGFVNARATIDAVRICCADRNAGAEVLIICSGTDGFPALEDMICAGRLVRGISDAQENVAKSDSARLVELAERPFAGGVNSIAHLASHAKRLDEAGFVADIRACLSLDEYDRAVHYTNGRLTHLSD